MGTDRVQRLERELQAVCRVTQALHTSTHPDDLCREALHVAIETLEARAGSILLHDPDREVLVFKHVIGATPEITERLHGHELPDSAGIAGQVLQSGYGRIDNEVGTASEHDRSVEAEVHYRTDTMVTVPLRTMGARVIGVLQVLNKARGLFDSEDLAVLTMLATQAASAIENSRLHQSAELARVAHLMGDIGHDVKNMLTPIMTGTEMLGYTLDGLWTDLDGLAESHPQIADVLREVTADPRQFAAEAVKMAVIGGRDVQERVREIADALKGIVSKPNFQLSSVKHLVESVTQVLDLFADNAGVRLDTTGVEYDGPVVLDRRRMFNCLYNLVNNAIPETPGGGRITLSSSPIEHDDALGGAGIAIDVADTGRGMSPEVKSKLFTDHAISTKSGGTGLGTRIVKKAVDVHGGTIEVTSEPGRGTTFHIRLPLEPPGLEA